MKSSATALVAYAGFVFAGAASTSGADWSAEQRAALSVVQESIDAEKAGDVAWLGRLCHENFVGWNLAEAAPVAKSPFLKAEAELLKTTRIPHYEISPLDITITEDVAVLNVTYVYTLVSSGGERNTVTGRLNAVLVKKDSRWLYLSAAWLDTK